jgi:hypothetical protein
MELSPSHGLPFPNPGKVRVADNPRSELIRYCERYRDVTPIGNRKAQSGFNNRLSRRNCDEKGRAYHRASFFV